MDTLSAEKLADIITLAEKLKLAAEHKSVHAKQIAKIRADAAAHIAEHDLVRYVGKELGLEAHYIEAALQALHPTQEQVQVARTELGVQLTRTGLEEINETLANKTISEIITRLGAAPGEYTYRTEPGAGGSIALVRQSISRSWDWKGSVRSQPGQSTVLAVFAPLLTAPHTLTLTVYKSSLLVLAKPAIESWKQQCQHHGVTGIIRT